MILDEYKTVPQKVDEGFCSEKRSKFLAFARHVTSEDEIKSILQAYKKRYYDAQYCCYTYMPGAERANFRANDDGESSSTAEKPILGQINSFELTDILVVVVRYSGGAKLGTSGFIVAYRSAAATAVEASQIEVKLVEETIIYTFAYPMMNQVMRIVKELQPRIVSQTFDNTCSITLAIRQSEAECLKNALRKLPFE